MTLTQILYPTALTLHIAGFVTLVGATLSDFTAFRQYRGLLNSDRPKALAMKQATSNFVRLTAMGAAVTILAGVGMMAFLHEVFGKQLWFQIKMGLVVLVILNTLAFGRRQGAKLGKLMAQSSTDAVQINMITGRLNFFYGSQLVLFFVIFVLSAFRFN
jgi:hypothetical protein